MFLKMKNFLMTGIWCVHVKSLSRGRAFIITQARIVLLALRGFTEDKCPLRASALTFFSLLSIVPVFAMAFGIAKGFGFDGMLEEQLRSKMTGQEEVVNRVIEFAQSFLNNTKGGLIAGIGVALLFWTVIKVLGNIEHSFNDIWGIKQARTMMRKFSDYLSIMLICPVLIIFSSSMTVYIVSQIREITESISLLGPISPLIFFLLKLVPHTVLWLMFSFIYIVMPNTNVSVKSGFFAGIIAGSIYQIMQMVYITFQIGASKYGAIYGSFAALPLFLVWLQISWLIVLFGAELSYAFQNVESYEFEPDCLNVSHGFKRLLTVRVVNMLVKNFTAGGGSLTNEHIGSTCEIPPRLLNSILFELTKAGLVVETKNDTIRQRTYQIACDVHTLSVAQVLAMLDADGSESLPIAQSAEVRKLSAVLQSFRDATVQSSENVLLKDI